MFPERWVLHEELNAFNRIAVQEMCIIIIAKVIWIGHMIMTHFPGFPRVDAHRTGHFVQPF